MTEEWILSQWLSSIFNLSILHRLKNNFLQLTLISVKSASWTLTQYAHWMCWPMNFPKLTIILGNHDPLPHMPILGSSNSAAKKKRYDVKNIDKWGCTFLIEYKTLWEKEKLLVTSNFFFSHNVFKSCMLLMCLNEYLWSKGLRWWDWRSTSAPRIPHKSRCIRWHA